jgi:hypothetical protein
MPKLPIFDRNGHIFGATDLVANGPLRHFVAAQ